MARIAKSTQQSPAAAKAVKAGKVARVSKGKAASAQQAPADKAPKAKRAKAAPASGQQAKLRGQYANKRIVVTAEGKAASPRGLRGDRWAIVAKAKRTDDFIGKPYTGSDGVERPFTAAKFANFVERGFVELAD